MDRDRALYSGARPLSPLRPPLTCVPPTFPSQGQRENTAKVAPTAPPPPRATQSPSEHAPPTWANLVMHLGRRGAGPQSEALRPPAPAFCMAPRVPSFKAHGRDACKGQGCGVGSQKQSRSAPQRRPGSAFVLTEHKHCPGRWRDGTPSPEQNDRLPPALVEPTLPWG